MNTYLITFQIVYPSIEVQNEIISNGIKNFKVWARPTPHVWLIKSYLTREGIIKELRHYLGPRDKVLVMRVSSDWIALHLDSEVIDWMKSEI